MESVPIPEHEVESEWESTETIDSIHLDRDKKSQRLVERKKKSQKPTKKSASTLDLRNSSQDHHKGY